MLALMLLSACAAAGDRRQFADCRNAPSEHCIVALAQVEFREIETDSEWVLGATEVAAALDASGNSPAASDLLRTALARAGNIEQAEKRAPALTQVATVLVDVGTREQVSDVLTDALAAAGAISDENKRWDATGKLAVIRAAIGESAVAVDAATGMPQSSDTLAAYKARTLHDIAPIQAQQEDLDAALATLSLIDMGLSYYRAVSRSDVARIANNLTHGEIAARLLREADDIARAQSDGYFVAGALRQIGSAYVAIGDPAQAAGYFSDALDGARTAATPQQRARALSRVATALADFGYYSRAIAVLPEASRIADSESSEQLRLWSFYEICGAAAFAGDFDTANALLEKIPASFSFSGKSLKAATQRDVAWGLARHRRLSDALDLAMSIEAPRERVQALSRIVRVIRKPDMRALPRYL